MKISKQSFFCIAFNLFFCKYVIKMFIGLLGVLGMETLMSTRDERKDWIQKRERERTDGRTDGLPHEKERKKERKKAAELS